MNKVFNQLLKLICALLVSGCASPMITQLSGDTYQIKGKDYRGAFGNPADFVASIQKEADDFAVKQGKKVQVVSMSESPMGPMRFYEFDYTFKLVDPFQTGSKLNYGQAAPNVPVQQLAETHSEKKARLAAEKNAQIIDAQRTKEMERANAKAERERQAAMREQEREWARQERVRLAEVARIQKEGDGSPDDLACKSYGFKPSSLPYAECRQKIAMQRQLVEQQQRIEMQRQRLAEQELNERHRQAKAREEAAADARRQAAADALLNIYNRQMDRVYESARQPVIIYERYDRPNLWER